MRSFTRFALVLGLAAVVALVVRNDADAIFNLLRRAGWPLLCLIPLHCVPLGLDVMGWRVLILERNRFAALFGIATIREAINRLLPVANVGGEVIGVRLLVSRGVSYPAAIASVVVEMTLNIVSQILFLALGLMCLLLATDRFELTRSVTIGVAGAAVIALVLLWILSSGALFSVIHRFGPRLLGAGETRRAAFDALAQIDAITRKLTSARSLLGKSIAWQLGGLVCGCSETWLALRLLAHPVSWQSAFALESLTVAARSFFFIAPAGLGVQEAGLIGIGTLLGLSSDVAIALSLAKRAREILFGLPALAAWHWMSGRVGAYPDTGTVQNP